MTVEEAKQTMYALACTHYGKEFYEKENEAIKIACKSLEAWEKVKEEINSMPYIIYSWDAVEIIDKHLSEVEHETDN